MAFIDRMREMVDQGMSVSKDFAVKAGAKAQDLGKKGVLMIEIKQLESQAQKLIGRLGAEAYNAFVERGEETLSKASTPVETMLSEIARVRESIEKKEMELKAQKE